MQPKKGAAVILSGKLWFVGLGKSVPGLDAGSDCCTIDLFDWKSKTSAVKHSHSTPEQCTLGQCWGLYLTKKQRK